ncbi:MAG: Uncharacterised protein [Cryomorphaceae bacterium]|nr:MAG: Uncharacterised protein [Cryomorphaceae bacterium]
MRKREGELQELWKTTGCAQRLGHGVIVVAGAEVFEVEL